MSLKVLTLNCWGLPEPLSKEKPVRMSAMAERLAASSYDIIALQELWVSSVDYKLFVARLSSRFPHSAFFYGGAFGMGLAIFSRHTIVSTQSRSYTYNGWPVAVAHGDWIVGKGAGCATIDVPDLPGGLDVWVTHTVAGGGEDGPEASRCPRISQTYEMAGWVRESAERGRHVIALGDFNCTPPSLSTLTMRHIALMTDAFLETHPMLHPTATSLPGSDGQPDPQQCIDELGVTCDSPLNTWSAGKRLDERAQKGAGKRLDYIYYTGPREPLTPFDRRATKGRLRVAKCKVCFTERIPTHGFSYTDHFGLEADFDVATEAAPLEITGNKDKAVEVLTSSLQAFAIGQQVAKKQQQIQLFGFTSLVIFAVALMVGSAFQPVQGVSAVFVFFGIAAGFGATTLLYSGLIWGDWEQRIFRTFRESMALELKRIRDAPRSQAAPSAATLI